MAATHSCSYSEWFDANRIYVKTDDEKTFSRPLEAFPLLKDATAIAVPKRNHQVYVDTFSFLYGNRYAVWSGQISYQRYVFFVYPQLDKHLLVFIEHLKKSLPVIAFRGSFSVQFGSLFHISQ